jgi:hypothetical protein
MRNAYKMLDSPKERDKSEDLGVDERKKLKWILGKQGFGYIGFIWLRIWTSGGIL